MAAPVVLSVSNLTGVTSASGTQGVSVTVPTGANACVIGATFYAGGAAAITFAGSGWLTVQSSDNFNDGSGNWMNGSSARCKVTATGAQTLNVTKSAALGEGPPVQIVWLTVDNPDDWVKAFARDGQNASPDTLSVTLASETGGLVIAVLGKDSNNGSSLPTPTGTTQIGSQVGPVNSDYSAAFSVDSVGASTTTVTAASLTYPTLFAVSVKAAAGGGGSQTLTAPLTTRSRSVRSPALGLGAVALAAPRVTRSRSVRSPALGLGAVTISAPLTTRSRSVRSPALSLGAVALTAPLTTRSRSVYAPALGVGAGGTQTLTAPLTARSRSVYAPALGIGAGGTQTINAPLTTRSRSTFPPALAPGQITIGAPLTARSRSLYPPLLDYGAITIAPPLVARSKVMFFPIISGGVAPSVSDSFLQPIIRRRRR